MVLSKTTIIALAGLLLLNLWSIATDFSLQGQLLVASLILGLVLFCKSIMQDTAGITKSREEEQDRRSAA